MHANGKTEPAQQSAVAHRARHTDSYRFFNLLTGPQLLNGVEALLPEHRERLFPPTETLSMFLAQALNEDRSCQAAVNESAIKRATGGLPRCSTHTGGYCKARQRLPLERVRSLVRHTGQWIDAQVPGRWRWQGRPVRLVDGTTVTLPDTPANQASYPQQSSQAAGLGFPICRIVGVTCLSSGAVLDAAVGPFQGKGANEQTLLRSLLDTFASGDVVLGDAFYATYFLLAELRSRGVDALFEQHGARQRSTDFRRGQKLGGRDHLITLDKPKHRPDWMTLEQYVAMPESLTVRELKVNARVLVTTLLCPHTAPRQALKDLYKSRWHVELDIRNIKTTLGMDTLSCRTPEMANKEMWVYLLAYNLIRMLMVQSSRSADVLPRTLSFKHAVQLWLAWTRCSPDVEDEPDFELLLTMITERRVGQRGGRIEPRAVKRRPRAFPLLMKPRPLAREQVRKHGHPKKAK